MAFRSNDGRLWFDRERTIELFQVGTRVRIVKSEAPSSLPNGSEYTIVEDPVDHGEECRDTGVIDADGDFQAVFVREAEIIDGSDPESENIGGEVDAVMSDESTTIKVSDYNAECWPVGTRVKIRPDIALTDDEQKNRWMSQIDKVFVVEAPRNSDVDLRPQVRGDYAFKWRFVLADDAEPAPARKAVAGDYIYYNENAEFQRIAFRTGQPYKIHGAGANLYVIDDDGDERELMEKIGRVVPSDDLEVKNLYGAHGFKVDPCWPVGTIVRPRMEWMAFGDEYSRYFNRKQYYIVVQRGSQRTEVVGKKSNGDDVYIYATKARFEEVPSIITSEPAPIPAHAAKPPLPEFDTTQPIGDNVHTVIPTQSNLPPYGYGRHYWVPGCVIEMNMLAYLERPEEFEGVQIGTHYVVNAGHDYPYIVADNYYPAALADNFDLISPPKEDDTDV